MRNLDDGQRVVQAEQEEINIACGEHGRGVCEGCVAECCATLRHRVYLAAAHLEAGGQKLV